MHQQDSNGDAPGDDAPVAVEDRRRPPFFWADTAVPRRHKEIEGAPFAVYCALASFANRGREAWPSHATVARMLGLHRVTVADAVAVLVDLGLVERVGRRGATNRYRLPPVAPGPADAGGEAPRLPPAHVAPERRGGSPGATGGGGPPATPTRSPRATHTPPGEHDHKSTTPNTGPARPPGGVGGPADAETSRLGPGFFASLGELWSQVDPCLDEAWVRRVAPRFERTLGGTPSRALGRATEQAMATVMRALAIPAGRPGYVGNPAGFAAAVWCRALAAAVAAGPEALQAEIGDRNLNLGDTIRRADAACRAGLLKMVTDPNRQIRWIPPDLATPAAGAAA